jgi:1-aminocyclopropane-1-carboxylate deaminase/D-cysteine desulfhydrase-like pyridoxal-dependent ACC family enzyme
MIPLFRAFPQASERLPWCSLGLFPTPVEELSNLAKHLGRQGLYVKRDDLSGNPYGGNKVRKLEFILADALHKGMRRIVTSGAAGSNHALATALYGQKLGLQVDLMLFAQPPTAEVRANLLADFHAGAHLHHAGSYAEHVQMMEEFLLHAEARRESLYCIPPGGSCAFGALGFVNAAFELKEQIERGELPEPDEIFIAYGTMGTAAGLALGIRAAGLHCRIRAIRVVPDVVANDEKYHELFESTRHLLIEAEPSLTNLSFDPSILSVEHAFYGSGYGEITREAAEAMELFDRFQGITLDQTYTGKAAAAFLAAVRQTPRDAHLLFWVTKNSCPLSLESQSINFYQLPGEFHRYFEGT